MMAMASRPATSIPSKAANGVPASSGGPVPDAMGKERADASQRQRQQADDQHRHRPALVAIGEGQVRSSLLRDEPGGGAGEERGPGKADFLLVAGHDIHLGSQ